MKAVVLLGPPGAGKGTVSESLAEKGFVHVSTGDLLRDQIRKATPLGLEAKKAMDAGKFVSDEIVTGMIREVFEREGVGNRFLLDGFPRTLEQAKRLDEMLDALSARLDCVVLLECPDDVIVERLGGRRVCPECGAVYHATAHPPKVADVCDRCATRLIRRTDDAPETVRRRLEIYAEQTAPLVEFYRNRGLVVPVDASHGIERVRATILEKLG